MCNAVNTVSCTLLGALGVAWVADRWDRFERRCEEALRSYGLLERGAQAELLASKVAALEAKVDALTAALKAAQSPARAAEVSPAAAAAASAGASA